MNTTHTTPLIPIIAAAFMLTAQAKAGILVTVPGTSDPWLAGMPNGSTASLGDSAPAESPVLATGLTISGGTTLQWSARGLVDNDSGAPTTDPDGDGQPLVPHYLNLNPAQRGAENGISDVTMPMNSLLGVFLGPGQPNLNPAPGALDFSLTTSRDYTSLSPALQQVFFMGDGRTSGGTAQSVVAPAGATRLFLGTMDSWGWFNNTGAFRVTAFDVAFVGEPVPEPRSFAFVVGLGLLGVAVWRRVRR